MMSQSKDSDVKMQADVEIRTLTAQEIGAHLDALSNVLIDCVESGASVSFLLPMTRDKADQFWNQIRDGVERGTHHLHVAEISSLGIIGTVLLIAAAAENQPHRADIAKMLVHRRARRRGVGQALMAAVEQTAMRVNKKVLVLDTVTGSAGDHLYLKIGWTRVGEIPDYALYPDGSLCPTSVFYKVL